MICSGVMPLSWSMSRIPIDANFGAKPVRSAALSCAKTSAKVPMVVSVGGFWGT